jgi:hypothetical protein
MSKWFATLVLVAGQSSSSLTLNGTWSSATLLAVERPTAAVVADRAHGAEDGLTFSFAIVRRQGAQGDFSLRELRDFVIGGRRYSSLTYEKLGRRFEPETEIYTASEFKKDARPDLASKVPAVSDRDQVIMRTVVPGSRLPQASDGEVTIEVGWGTNTETFTFRFRTPQSGGLVGASL